MLVLALLAGAVSLVAGQAALTISSVAGLAECQPSLLTWSGGVAPYYVTVLPGSMPSAAPLLTLVTASSATSYTWNVNLAAGTSITLAIKDSKGTINYSQASTIGAGSTGCLSSAAGAAGAAGAGTAAGTAKVSTATVSRSGTAAAAGATSASVAAATTTAASAASTGMATSLAALASSTASASASASSTTARAAGVSNHVVGGLAGLVGFAALLV